MKKLLFGIGFILSGSISIAVLMAGVSICAPFMPQRKGGLTIGELELIKDAIVELKLSPIFVIFIIIFMIGLFFSIWGMLEKKQLAQKASGENRKMD